MSIECIALEKLVQQQSHKFNHHLNHARVMLCLNMFSNDSKKYSSTTSADRKHTIEMLNKLKMLPSKLITLWENTNGCTEHYRCATVLFLLSMLSQVFYVIIHRSVSETGHGGEVVDELNTTNKKTSFTVKLEIPIDRYL